MSVIERVAMLRVQYDTRIPEVCLSVKETYYDT